MTATLRVNLSAFTGEDSVRDGEIAAIRMRVDYAGTFTHPWVVWDSEIDLLWKRSELRDGNAPIVVTGRCPAALAVLFACNCRTGTRKLSYVDTLRGETHYVVNNNESNAWHVADALTPMRLVETVETFVAPSTPHTVLIFLNFGMERTITPQQLGAFTPSCIATWRPGPGFSSLFKSDDALQLRDNIYVMLRDLHRNNPDARFAFATTGPIAAAMLFATVYNAHIYGRLALFELFNGTYVEVAQAPHHDRPLSIY